MSHILNINGSTCVKIMSPFVVINLEEVRMNKKHVAVIGATGQVGTPLTRGLLKEGHEVTILTRQRSDANDAKLADHENFGAKVVVCPDLQNVDSVVSAVKECDTLVACVPGSKTIIQQSEPV